MCDESSALDQKLWPENWRKRSLRTVLKSTDFYLIKITTK